MTSVLPKLTSLSSRVIRVLGCNPGPMTLQGTNTYIIGTGKKRVLLDTGHPDVPEYIDLLKNTLKEEECTLEKILLSHWHIDHIGGVADILREISHDFKVYKFPEKGTELHSDSNIEFNVLKDGEVIQTEGATLKVIYGPGHTTDHIVLHLEEENSLFSGDCILGEGSAVFEDLHDYMITLNSILKLEPDVIYPGHGPVISNPKVKILEYIQHRMKREKEIMCALKEVYPKGLTAEELVSKIYTTTPAYLHKAAEVNVCHHLRKLLKENSVSEQEEIIENVKIQRFTLL